MQRRTRLRSVLKLAVHFSILGKDRRRCNCNSRNNPPIIPIEPVLPWLAPSSGPFNADGLMLEKIQLSKIARKRPCVRHKEAWREHRVRNAPHAWGADDFAHPTIDTAGRHNSRRTPWRRLSTGTNN